MKKHLLKLFFFSLILLAKDSNCQSTGTGFAISYQGYIATNYHVIEGSDKISVKIPNGNVYDIVEAKVIKVDKSNDLAIIKVNMNFESIPYGIKSNKQNIASKVYAYGFPLPEIQGQELKITEGIINSNSGQKDDPRWYQHTSEIQAGNSGGPLINKDGDVVGINVAKLNSLALNLKYGTGATNVNYAIKVRYLLNLMEDVDIPKTNNKGINNLEIEDQYAKIKNYVFQIISNKKEKDVKFSLQNAYRINGEVKGLLDTTVLLAYYFGGNQYAKDTAYSVNGKFTFKGGKELLEGMYLIVLPDQKYFDIILTEQNFSFSTSLNNVVDSMKFKGSAENPLFYQYLKFITKKQREVSQLKNQLASEKRKSRKLIIEKNIESIDKEVITFRDEFIEKNSNLFFTKIIKSTIEISIPESPLDSTGNPDKNFPFRFYKKNFWNNIDLTDERMLRTPVFHNKMTQYLEKLTVKNPDSIIESADLFISKIKNNDIFKYVVSHITSTYERSKIMGMDAVFVHMVENYYMQDKCDWVDEKQLKKIVERAEKIAPNLIGRVAPEFVDIIGRPFMKDPNGKTFKLSDVKSEYTILVFYAPDCGHCKKEIPRIKEVTDSLNLNGIDIKVFAVTTEFDKEEWIKFIKEKNTENWINVGDIQKDEEGNPMASSDWRDKYDIYSTPVVYLLDSNKKILAKRISYEQIVEIIALKEK